MRRICSIFSTLALFVLPADSAPTTVEHYMAIYENKTLAIEADHHKTINEINKRYDKYLDKQISTTKDKGNLERYKTLKEEKVRLAKENTIPADSSFAKHIQTARIKKNAKLIKLTKKYVAGLTKLKISFMKQDKIDEAEKVNAEIKRVESVVADLGSQLPGEDIKQLHRPQERKTTKKENKAADSSEWKSVIWNKRISLWQMKDLDNLSNKFIGGTLWVKNTHKNYRAAKTAYGQSLVGDFTIELEIKGRFGVELMHTSGQSGRGYGVYGFPTEEWLGLTISRSNGILSVDSSDGRDRRFKGRQDNPRVPLDLCISLSPDSEIKIRHFKCRLEHQDWLKKKVNLKKPYPTSYSGARRDKISVQYAVIEILKQVGVEYDWDESFKNTNPTARKYITPNIRNMKCEDALHAILSAEGLSYKLEGGKVVLIVSEMNSSGLTRKEFTEKIVGKWRSNSGSVLSFTPDGGGTADWDSKQARKWRHKANRTFLYTNKGDTTEWRLSSDARTIFDWKGRIWTKIE